MMRAATGVLGFAFLFIGPLGCSKTPPSPAPGLTVNIRTDMSSDEYDAIRVEVSQKQETEAGFEEWVEIVDNSYAVPAKLQLPAMFFVENGHSSSRDALIQIAAYGPGRNGTGHGPVVLREVQPQVPNDRVDHLDILLASVCKWQVVTGRDGEPQSTCPVGKSCQPDNGACGPGATPNDDAAIGPESDSADGTIVDSTVDASTDTTIDADGGTPGDETAADGASDATTGDATIDAGDAAADAREDADAMPPAVARSCQTGAAGTALCGVNPLTSCCTSLLVDGGVYQRTSMGNQAVVSDVRIDQYEVTVGRFRQFASRKSEWLPATGLGKHTHLNGGQGLVNSAAAAPGAFETGWVRSDDLAVQPTNMNLQSDACAYNDIGQIRFATWTPSPGNNENLPINCVTWQEALAFCIWDGGFLPSESEWEYAAVGGDQERLFPWGSMDPGTNNEYAIYGYFFPTGQYAPTGVDNFGPVGTPTRGAGRWRHFDLAGNVWEWTLDWYAAYVEPCIDCAFLTRPVEDGTGPFHVIRGGALGSDPAYVSPRVRDSPPPDRNYGVGFRCARSPLR